MSICQREERAAGRPYPRTCPTCKLGPCSRSTMATDPKDAEIARLTAELFEMTRSRDEWRNDFRALEKAIVGDTGLSAMTVAVQARLFRPRAEKAEAERDAALARESALLASNQSKRELLYKLTGAQSEVIHMRNRFDTAVATARAEGRKDGLREAAAMCDDTAQEALEESGAESRAIWTWFRGQRDAILAAAEKEKGNG